MDDYNLSSLEESKNEWSSRLVSILTSSIITGVMSIYKEALRMCDENDQEDKYLMTFQNLLTRVPEWNPTIVETERKRIEHESRCKYLEDLVTCVHIIQLKALTCIRVGQKQKALTCIRVGQKQKKIDLDIPSIDKFIHKVYINTARKLYTNSYLFEKNIPSLEIQKNNYQLERLVKESILMTIRDNIPIEEILRVYMDETDEQNIEVTQQEVITEKPKDNKISEEIAGENIAFESDDRKDINEEVEKEIQKEKDPVGDTLKAFIEKETDNINLEINSIKEDKSLENKFEVSNEENSVGSNKLNFSDIDTAITDNGEVENIEAPKTIERLNQISMENAERRKQEEEDENDEKIEFGEDANIEIDDLDISDIEIIR
jgi:hypothetical protein